MVWGLFFGQVPRTLSFQTMATSTVRGTVGGMAGRANPAFAGAVVVLPLAALCYALTVAPLQHLTYVHVMAGLVWTGVDVFLGVVLGPVIGGLDDETSSAIFQRLTPKLTFLLPTMALVTIAAGITLCNLVPVLLLIAYRLDTWRDWRRQVPFALATVGSLAWVGLTIDLLLSGAVGFPAPAITVALVVVTILSVQGFGFLLPGEVRIYLEMASADPDHGITTGIGKQNAMLGGVQGFFQLLLIFDMVYLRFGGF